MKKVPLVVVLCLLFALPGLAFERMSAWQDSVVEVVEGAPFAALVTYDNSRPDQAMWFYQFLAGKLAVGVESAGGCQWLAGTEIHSFPWGLELAGKCGKAQVQVAIAPLFTDWHDPAQLGGAIFKVIVKQAPPASRLVLLYGGLAQVRVLGSTKRLELVKTSAFPAAANDALQLANGATVLQDKAYKALQVAFRVPGVACSIQPPGKLAGLGESAGPVARAEFPLAKGRPCFAIAAFAGDAQKALALAEQSPEAAFERTRSHFQRLVESAECRTGLQPVDEAFKAALLNLEYTWYRGYGWIESLHHWTTMFSQLHTQATDELGQADRSRSCLLHHAEALASDGRVRSFNTAKQPWRTFGWNQYFVDDLAHYLDWTGDEASARKLYPALKAVIANTRKRFDADDNGLIGWGQQIGYQEDYVMAPADCASATMSYIRMLQTAARFAKLAGKPDEALQYRRRAEASARLLKAKLFDARLGRFVYWQDSLGTRRLEGLWHTFSWPVLQGVLSPVEAWPGLYHVEASLMSPRGLPYLSNLFPTHVPHTTGCQEGDLQAMTVAKAFAAGGQADAAVKIVNALAQVVLEPPNSGAFPETIVKFPTWFSPPAAWYVKTVVEGLFGLHPERIAKVLEVAPALPDNLAHPALKLPRYRLEIHHSSGKYRLHVKAEGFDTLKLAPWLAPAKIQAVHLNGDRVPFTVKPGVDRLQVCVQVPFQGEAVMEIDYRPFDYKSPQVLETYPGATLEVSLPGLTLVGLVNSTHALKSWQKTPTGLELTLADDLLELADAYGKQGRLVFGDRTALVEVEKAGVRWFLPLKFKLEPAIELTDLRLERQGEDFEAGFALGFKVINHTERPVKALEITCAGLSARLEADLAPGSAKTLQLPLTWEQIGRLQPGHAIFEWNCPGTAFFGSAQFDTTPLFEQSSILAKDLKQCLRHVPLPSDLLKPASSWRTWRPNDDLGHPPWNTTQAPLNGLKPDAKGKVELSTRAGVTFDLVPGKLLPLGYPCKQPSLHLPLKTKAAKVFVLVAGFLNNEDTYAPIASLDLLGQTGVIAHRVLHFPGDLDWEYPPKRVAWYSSLNKGWSKAETIVAPEAVFSVIELTPRQSGYVESLELRMLAEPATLAIAAVTVLVPRKPSPALPDWLTGGKLLLADFETGTLEGWQKTGSAWGVGKSYERYQRYGEGAFFADSLAYGESATGTLCSAPFTIKGNRLTWLADGWSAQGQNYFALVDATTGKLLKKVAPPDHTGEFIQLALDVSAFRGRKVKFCAVDGASEKAYAWLAFDNLMLEP